MSDNLVLIDSLIASQVRMTRLHLVVAAILMIVGLLVVAAGVLAQQLNSTFSKGMWLSIVGGAGTVLSAFPIRELILRREKTDALRMLRSRVQNLESQATPDSAEIERIKTMLWESVKTILER